MALPGGSMLNKLRERRERRMGRILIEDSLKIERLKQLLSEISSKNELKEDKVALLIEKKSKHIEIPATLFNNKLSPLESLVLYLNIRHGLSKTEIAGMLNRDTTTIWTTVENALKKMKKVEFKKFIENIDERVNVPVEIFSNRKLSVLESISMFLKEKHSMRYHDIAKILGKDDRTIWTVVNRAKKKE